jgi:hypothetical protein
LLGQRPDSLDSAQGGEAESGMRRRPTRAGASGRARGGGLRASQAESRGEKEFPFSFSFSIISKHFQMILNPILNLNQTTPTKNSNATA